MDLAAAARHKVWPAACDSASRQAAGGRAAAAARQPEPAFVAPTKRPPARPRVDPTVRIARESPTGGAAALVNSPAVARMGGSRLGVDFKIAIVGSGPAGLSAAARAARRGVSHVLLERSAHLNDRSEEHTSELQSRRDLVCR